MSTTKWIIDPTHSEVSFKVKHLVISTVTGYFKKFEGAVESDSEDFDGAKVNFTADIDSIDTNQSDRDNHLKSADFFDAANHPQLSFSGTIQASGGEYKLLGDLTMRGTTKAVELDVDFGGVAADPYGQTKAGFEIEGKVNRKEFGLTWSAVTEAGNVVVSDQVKLLLSVQVVKQASE
ncbi:YceI family protein [Algoriphagus namhaensis]